MVETRGEISRTSESDEEKQRSDIDRLPSYLHEGDIEGARRIVQLDASVLQESVYPGAWSFGGRMLNAPNDV